MNLVEEYQKGAEAMYNSEAIAPENLLAENVQPIEPTANVEQENTPVVEEPTAVENEQPKVDNKGSESNNVQETTESAFANEELANANAYMKRTGKDYDYYKSLLKPNDELSNEELLKQFYTEKGEIGKAGLKLKMKSLEVYENFLEDGEDFESEDEPETLKMIADIENELREASKWREQERQNALNPPTTEKETIKEDAPMTVEQFFEEQSKKDQVVRDKFLDNLYATIPTINTFPVEVNGEVMQWSLPKEDAQEFRTSAENLKPLLDSLFDEEGQVKDMAKYLDFVVRNNPKLQAKREKFMIEQAVQAALANHMKERKNITVNSENSKNMTAVETNGYGELYQKNKNNSF